MEGITCKRTRNIGSNRENNRKEEQNERDFFSCSPKPVTIKMLHMPCETLVCHPRSFAAPPCARREPLQKPVIIFNRSKTEFISLSQIPWTQHLYWSELEVDPSPYTTTYNPWPLWGYSRNIHFRALGSSFPCHMWAYATQRLATLMMMKSFCRTAI